MAPKVSHRRGGAPTPAATSATPAPAADRRHAGGSTDYVRFIILSGPRTGSHMLAQALNSHPQVVCFREVFNFLQNFIQFEMEGYDNFDPRDIALRKEEPIRFLEERIFCAQPDHIRAVGFKLHYGQLIGFPGVMERLSADGGLRVVHLRRRNLLRMLVSLKLAQTTGVFLRDTRRRSLAANLRAATAHPLRAVTVLRRRLERRRVADRVSRPRVAVSPQELFEFIVRTNIRAANHEKLFDGHAGLPVFYEDLLDRREEVLEEVQSFLGVESDRLTITLARQNPEPLSDLIENYGELHEAYKHTREAAYFD